MFEFLVLGTFHHESERFQLNLQILVRQGPQGFSFLQFAIATPSKFHGNATVSEHRLYHQCLKLPAKQLSLEYKINLHLSLSKARLSPSTRGLKALKLPPK